jgi:GntR family transcriptional regulator/MocR family aminotransferase
MSTWLRLGVAGSQTKRREALSGSQADDAPSDMPLAIAELKFDSSSLVPIRQQICEAIRAAIWSHQLPPGTLLPNSRVLADHLGVSRNTVVFAYTRLVNESLCESKTRRGTRVARDIPYFSQAVETPRLEAPPACAAPLRAAFAARHALEVRANRVCDKVPFALIASDPVLYPRTKLGRRLADKFLGAPPAIHNSPNNALCITHFQKSVAAYLRNVRGVVCDPEQVVAVSGLESALNLTARVLIDPGDSVAVEDPAMDIVRSAFLSAGAQMFPISSDGQGANPSRMRGPPARLIYVSPSVSFPFGAQMLERRRLEILAAARSQNAIVFECDTCGELRYGGGRIKSLYGLDTDRRVIHYGGFFQTLGVFVNVGYLVVPKVLRDYFREIGCLVTTTPPAPVLDAIAEFVEENEYAAHVRTVRSVYAKRLETVKRACKETLPDAAVSEPLGGLHVVLQFDADFDECAVSEMAVAENLPVRSLSQYYQQKCWQKGLVLGFGAVSDQAVPSLVGRVCELIAEAKKAARAPAAKVSR